MPTSVTALLIVVYTAVPGYAYLYFLERRFPRDARTSAREIVEIFGAGFMSTGVVALALLAVGQTNSAFLPLGGLVAGQRYLQEHPWQVIVSASSLLVLSVVASAGLGISLGRREQRVVREGNVWTGLLTRTREGRRPYIAVELMSGRLVEGYLLAASDHIDSDKREIALQAPLAESAPGQPRTRSNAAFIILRGSEIRMISAAFPTVPQGGADAREQEPGSPTGLDAGDPQQATADANGANADFRGQEPTPTD